MKYLIDSLNKNKSLNSDEWITLFENYSETDRAYAAEIARGIAKEKFGNKIYIRGIVEFSNYCKNDCYYCGIRCSNGNASRYRLSKDEILDCCIEGYEYGFRTFVLQSGEDGYYTTERMAEIVSEIKAKFPDCAVTLSLGERAVRTISVFMMQVQTAICSAMKRQILIIMASSTPKRCPLKTGCNVSVI